MNNMFFSYLLFVYFLFSPLVSQEFTLAPGDYDYSSFVSHRNKENGQVVNHLYIARRTRSAEPGADIIMRSAFNGAIYPALSLLPEKVKINKSGPGEPVYEHPLRAQTIYQFAVQYGKALVTSGNMSPTSLGILCDGFIGSEVQSGGLYASIEVKDRSGNITGNIKHFASDPGGALLAVAGSGHTTVTQSTDGGLAYILFKEEEKKDARDGFFTLTQKQDTHQGVQIVSDADIQIDNAAAVKDVSALVYDAYFKKYFVACATENGGIAVLSVTPTLSQDILFTPLISITDPTVWDSDNHIIASKSARDITIHSLHVMHTLTGSAALIVQGGAEKTVRDIYALPLIDTSSSSSSHWGLVAKKGTRDQLPTGGDTSVVTTNDSFAVVGGGSLPTDPVKVLVAGNVVYACLAGSTVAEQGLFASEALFAENGSIRGWTKWHCVAGKGYKVYNAIQDMATSGYLLWVENTTTGEKNTLYRTTWNNSQYSDLLTKVNKYASSSGGFHMGAVVEASAVPMLTKDTFIIGGHNKIVIAQEQAGGNYEAHEYDMPCGVVTSVCYTPTDPGWILVGGTRGIAVITKALGEGFATGTFTSSDYTTLGMTIINSQELQEVKSISADATHAYIMTASGLYTVSLNKNSFASSDAFNKACTVITTASVLTKQSDTYFTSFFHAPSCVLLATNKGLFQLEQGTSLLSPKWKEVVLARNTNMQQAVPLLIDMYGVQDAAGRGWDIYTLFSDWALNTSVVYHFTAYDGRDVCPVFYALGEQNYTHVLHVNESQEYLIKKESILLTTGPRHHLSEKELKYLYQGSAPVLYAHQFDEEGRRAYGIYNFSTGKVEYMRTTKFFHTTPQIVPYRERCTPIGKPFISREGALFFPTPAGLTVYS